MPFKDLIQVLITMVEGRHEKFTTGCISSKRLQLLFCPGFEKSPYFVISLQNIPLGRIDGQFTTRPPDGAQCLNLTTKTIGSFPLD